MGHKLAIDFGTTNSVIARWQAEAGRPEIITLPGLSIEEAERPPLVPSLLYVNHAQTGLVTVGQAVSTQQLDKQHDNRLFRNFKRGIVTAQAPDPRIIDKVEYSDKSAGQAFIRAVLKALPYKDDDIEQLVLTVPVVSFESYITWLHEAISEIAAEKVRIVDESTAAALGYAVTEPGAVVLVFDFGGGTLDLSLVQLPESREKTGGFLNWLVKRPNKQNSARVIAKAGKIIGGSDIDQWLLAEVLRRASLTTQQLGAAYSSLLTACELAKIRLSTAPSTEIAFEAAGRTHQVTFKREDFEALLEANGFSLAIRRVVDKVMHVCHQRGIFKEDIHYVLLVGGTSLMPLVQRTLKNYFTEMTVRADKPFTAVAEGALQVAAGLGLDDYLAHSYGLRYLDEAGNHQWDEIIPMGSRYPSDKPTEVILKAAHADQTEVEFLIGEIDSDAMGMLEVKYEDGQAVFVAQGNGVQQKIQPLNADRVQEALARLLPPGQLNQDRLKALFRIDDRRQLRISVTDLRTQKLLINDVVLTTLR